MGVERENVCWPSASVLHGFGCGCDSTILRSYGPSVPAVGKKYSMLGLLHSVEKLQPAGISSQTPSLICRLVGLGGNLQIVGAGCILLCIL